MTAPVSAETLSDLIGSIYDCALDPERWPATLRAFREALTFRDAVMAVIEMPSGRPLLMMASGIEPQWLERISGYGAEIVEQWGGPEVLNSYPIEEPLVLSWQQPRSKWENNRYAVEWCIPQGLIDALAFTLTRDGATHGSIGMSRHASAGPIAEREVEAARLLIPHFQRAVAISKVLDLKSVVAASFAAALDALASAVVLVDADLRIVHANEAAEGMLRSGDPIASERGALTIRSRAAHAALGLAVRQAAEEEAAIGRRGFGIPAPRADGEPAVLHVLPLRHGTLRPGLKPNAAAAIFVAPAVAPAPAPSEALSALFDLTAAEARVLSQIAAGKTLLETARQLGVGASTAKTHLLRVFNKTGTSRQADLIKLADSLSML